MRMHLRTFSRLFIAEVSSPERLRFLVALAPVRDLFLFAKHKFVAARRYIVFARHFAVTILLPLRKFFSPTPSPPRGAYRFAPDPISKRKKKSRSRISSDFSLFRFSRFVSTIEASTDCEENDVWWRELRQR